MAQKLATEMTEQEAKEYCEKIAQQGEWEKDFIESSLKDGDSYRQIAYFMQTN